MTDRQKLKEHTLDEAFKKLIANKAVLAPILHEVIDGFQDYSLEEIAACIKPSSRAGSSGGKQAEILNLEDYGEDGESQIVYDCLVELDAAKIPSQIYANIVVDTEMQHDKPKYVLENRAQYYVARLLSRQLRAGSREGYDVLVPAYTIWLVRKPYKEQRNRVRHFALRTDKGEMITDKKGIPISLMHVVMVYLPEPGEESRDELIRYIMAVFTNHLGDSKLTKLIQKDREARKGVEEVMTLDEVVRREGRQQGIEEGMIQGIVKMCKEFGLSLLDAVEKVISELNLTKEEAEEKVKEYWD